MTASSGPFEASSRRSTIGTFDRVEERLNGIDGRLCRIEQDVRSNTSILAHLAESVAMIQDHLTKMPEIGDRLREAAHDLRESLKMPSEEPH